MTAEPLPGKIPVSARDLRRGDIVGGGDEVRSRVYHFPKYVSVVVRSTNGVLSIRAWDVDAPDLNVTRPSARVA